MHARARVFVLLVSLLLPAFGNGGPVDDEHFAKKMAKNLQEASEWLIGHGIEVVSEKGKSAIHRKLVDEWGVLLWVDPWIDEDGYLAQFRIKARGINYQIINLHKEQIGGTIYEFWVVKVVAKPWSGEKNRSMFYLTSTQSKSGTRSIVDKTDQFGSSYRINGYELSLPIDDVDLLYKLEAWEFSDNYQNSSLPDKKVIMDRNGNIELEDLPRANARMSTITQDDGVIRVGIDCDKR